MIGTELLKGQGLGNQLFCYVTTRCIAKERGEDFAILGGETLANNIHSDCGLYFMDLDLGVSAKKEDFKGTYYEKEDRIYTGRSKHDMEHGAYVTGTDEGMFTTDTDMLLFGNMQSEEYFIKYKEDIKQWLKVKEEYDCYDFCKDDLCVMHLRCSDYMGSPELYLKKSYWKKGMKHMKKINPNMQFVIITNDVKEANKFLPGIPAYQNDLAKDYSIIKNAKYLLLSNSSFTYFPAFTSETVQYILAPKYWARHNVSNGYWASEQNIYTGFHYMDRQGRVFTAEECRKQLEEYKRSSRTYQRVNQKPGAASHLWYQIESSLFYYQARGSRIIRGIIRRCRKYFV